MKIDSFSGDFRFLSNFYPSTIILFPHAFKSMQIVFPCVENAYQALKTDDLEVRKQMALMTPTKAKRFGRQLTLSPHWDSMKVGLMHDLLLQKFQIPDLREALFATKGFELIEGNYWGDTFWGVCNGVGQNHLGKILMRIRDAIKEESPRPNE